MKFKYEVTLDPDRDQCLGTASTWIEADTIAEADKIMAQRIENEPFTLGAEIIGISY